MCADSYHNRERSQCAMLRAWAFGDEPQTERRRTVRVSDPSGRHPTRWYSYPAALDSFGAIIEALAQYRIDINYPTGTRWDRHNPFDVLVGI